MKILNIAAAAVAGILALGGSTQAGATIYNISATAGSPVVITLAQGSYQISWVGVADGGLYDAWNGNCPTGACTGGWTNTFNVIDLPVNPNNFTVSVFGVGLHATALESLHAIQTSATMVNGDVHVVGGVAGAFIPNTPIALPWIAHVDGGSFRFAVGDNTLANNFGGVSLDITAVPEPASWALLVGGFGLAGAALRSRRRPIFAA
ncbi:MAG: hypothetical protein JWQ29_1127 [Phenylobacterium sp.]|nr:hypothetical protein [Phenylobacterium sp.]